MIVALTLAAGSTLAGCSSDEPDSPTDARQQKVEIELTSTAFDDGDTLPAEHTCAGAGTLPPLAWTGVPEETVELALFVVDDTADGYLHLAAAGLDPERGALDEMPEGARLAENGKGEIGWTPPCPPEGDEPHTYRFLLLALPDESILNQGDTPDQARKALAQPSIGQGRLSATFSR